MFRIASTAFTSLGEVPFPLNRRIGTVGGEAFAPSGDLLPWSPRTPQAVKAVEIRTREAMMAARYGASVSGSETRQLTTHCKYDGTSRAAVRRPLRQSVRMRSALALSPSVCRCASIRSVDDFLGSRRVGRVAASLAISPDNTQQVCSPANRLERSVLSPEQFVWRRINDPAELRGQKPANLAQPSRTIDGPSLFVEAKNGSDWTSIRIYYSGMEAGTCRRWRPPPC